MRRPLVFIATFYIVGILFAKILPSNNNYFLFLPAVFFITMGFYFHFKRKVIFLFGIFFITGFFNTNSNLYYNDKFLESISINESEIKMSGEVKEILKTTPDFTKIKFKVNEFILNSESYKKKEDIVVYLKEQVFEGENLVINGNLIKPEPQRTFGGYNEKLNLQIEKINFKSYATIETRKNTINLFTYYLYSGRRSISNIYSKLLPPKEASLAIAMVVGDTSYLEDDIRDLYIQGGIYHILAISGMHITFLISSALFVFKKIFLNRTSIVITILILLYYCLFSGANPSVVRAVLMGVLLLFGQFIYRETDLLTSLAFSSLCVLIYNPIYLFSISFQLSYICVLALAIAYEPLCRFFTNLKKYSFGSYIFSNDIFLSAFSGTFAVNLFITPFLLYYYYALYPYSIFANIIILQTTSLVLVLSFLVGIAGIIFLPLGIFLSGSLYYIFKFYEFICIFFNKLPFSNLILGRPNFFTILFYYGIIIFFLLYHSKVKYRTSFYKNGFYFCSVLLVVSAFTSYYQKKEFSLTMLDVGQGDSFVISESRKYYMIDGGANDFVLKNHLNYLGTNIIEGVFISHTDTDHLGGILDLIETKSIKNIFLPLVDYLNDENYIKLVKSAEKNNISIHFVKSGDIINFGKNLTFEVIHPNAKSNLNLNDSSLVLKMIYDDKSFLFTGDIEAIGEENILKTKINLNADILKISHHGSKTSTTDKFLEKVNPKVALISVSKYNSYGHPNIDVIDKLLENKIKIFRTDKNGSVSIKIKNDNIFIRPFLNDK